MVQIQFLDKNIVSVLVPVFSTRPECVVFLYDTRTVSERGKKDIEDAIKMRLPKTRVQFERVNMHMIDEIKSVLERVVDIYKNHEIEVDITGGSELMTACGLWVCREHNLTPIYADYYTERIFHVFTYERLYEIEHISFDDYLTAVGGKYLASSDETPEEADFDRITRTAEYIFSHMYAWKEFFRHITNGYSATGIMSFSMGKLARNRQCMDLLHVFLREGFCEQQGKDSYRFSSEIDKRRMTVYGIWLEMYIYIKASECYDEVLMGTHIDWNDSDHMDLNDNEIDVLVMRRSQPIFISCKMTEVKKEAVYEVNALAKRLGGDYAKSFVATTDRLSEIKDEASGMYQRLVKMKVGLIEVNDFKKKKASDVFARALQMTE